MSEDPDGRVAHVRHLIERRRGTTHGDNASGLMQQVCAAAADALSASGTGVSVITGKGLRGVTAASDPASEHLEELQFLLGEGPCMDAWTDRRPVLMPDLGAGALQRWPAYVPAAYEAGLRAVFAFPLQVGAVRLGVLDVYRTRPGALSVDDLAHALTFADVAVATLLDQQEEAAARGETDALDGAVEHRAQLFQAQGMVMVQLGISLDEAMSVLRAYAYAENRRLEAVADDVVSRRLRFDPDAGRQQ
jgi:GAF domain-containing protein